MKPAFNKRTDTVELLVSLGVTVPAGFLLARKLRGSWLNRVLGWFPGWLRRVSMSSDLFAGLALLVPGLLAGPWRPGEQEGEPAACVHRYVRHPVYAGIPMVLSGLGWLTNRMGLLLAGLLYIPAAVLLGWGEDKRLQGRYHTRYRAYHDRTPSIVPDLGRLADDLNRCALGRGGEEEDDDSEAGGERRTDT